MDVELKNPYILICDKKLSVMKDLLPILEKVSQTEQFENLYQSGVIDLTKVTRIALENAASIAGLILTTECVIFEKPEKEKNKIGSEYDSR